MPDLSYEALPDVVRTYLERSQGEAPGTAIEAFAEDATVADDGQTYAGREEIAGWLGRAAAAFEYTTTFLAAEADGAEVTVTNRLEGDFPGGLVDLHFRFVLEDGRIAALTIAP